MPHQDSPHIDFEEWRQLAQDDPSAFEQRRHALLESVIETAPSSRRRRLRGLQWRIDQTRRRAGSPLGACVTISRMMLDTVYGNRGLLAAMRCLENPSAAPFPPGPKARILPLRPEQRKSQE